MTFHRKIKDLGIGVRLVLFSTILFIILTVALNTWIATERQDSSIQLATDFSEGIYQNIMHIINIGHQKNKATNSSSDPIHFFEMDHSHGIIKKLKIMRGAGIVNEYGYRISKAQNSILPIEDKSKLFENSETKFVCPMHPEIYQLKPGKCSICGMTLEPNHAHNTKVDEKKINSDQKSPLLHSHITQVMESGKMQVMIHKEKSGDYLMIIRPIFATESCLSCHHVAKDSVLGTLTMNISLDKVNQNSSDFRLKLFIAAIVFLFIFIAGIAYFSNNSITSPLKKISVTLTKISRGDLTDQIKSDSSDEIGKLQLTLGDMTNKMIGTIFEIKLVSEKTSNSAEYLNKEANLFTKTAQNLALVAEHSSISSSEMVSSINIVNSSIEKAIVNQQEIETKILKLNKSVYEVSDSVEKLNLRISELKKRGDDGKNAINGTHLSMDRIKETASQIAKISKFITDISKQINLLSLNAAIESTRAGDSGKGFAIVADSISKLADSTARNVKEISQLIKALDDAVITGTEQIQDSAIFLGEIINGISDVGDFTNTVTLSMDQQLQNSDVVLLKVKELSASASDMTSASLEQSRVAKEINEAILSVSRASISIAAGSKKLALVVSELYGQTEIMKSQINKFKI